MSADSESRIQSSARGVYTYGQRQVDRVISPETRQKHYNAVTNFAMERPLVFAFIASQLLFSALPLALFISFSISTGIFAFVSAVVFSLFWIGVALLVLVPILFVSFSAAVLVWLWAIATFLVGRWIYRMMPVSMQGDMQVKMPNGKQVIFQKERNSGVGLGFDDIDIKEGAAEVKD
ncbi:hypothetical protein JX265_009909 [Neoarthrinium moseri]|uniref:Uncharacterized protein n=1 Tax=Neoarthrinium moseri TaxID=1658444 RepID=A0A9Q0AKW1_9PEZI|nr:uncharacterized protein JN550_008548 [Neoarthrinium moseri]KAI1843170.1 hypothetical protein JX266_010697 [Neoarthrinium moseri]KAI1860510.1 hypothetical protein JX265_009909 [Neoarthrinium moseri]KAI1865002.1 hypothetical protein JN550_008548 [Neoarthrinium moseri]